MSVVLNRKSLLLFLRSDLTNPIELSMNAKYGHVLDYHWCSANMILVGFESGHLVAVSTNKATMGQEIFHGKNFKDSLSSLDISIPLNKSVSCGDSFVKVQELSNLQDFTDVLTIDEGRTTPLRAIFSEDGQFLTVSTKEY